LLRFASEKATDLMENVEAIDVLVLTPKKCKQYMQTAQYANPQPVREREREC
jgi:hypothetical protein